MFKLKGFIVTFKINDTEYYMNDCGGFPVLSPYVSDTMFKTRDEAKSYVDSNLSYIESKYDSIKSFCIKEIYE